MENEINIPPRPSRAPRVEHQLRRRLSLKSKATGLLLLGALTAGAVVTDMLDIIDLPFVPDISFNPGQQPGETSLNNIDVKKFQASGTDAIGEADIVVSSMTQKWIDKKDKDEESNVHETMVLRNGLYTAQWLVEGTWDPKKQANGDLLVTLPEVKGKNIVTKEDGDPEIDQEKSSSAFWQWLGSIPGDDTDDAVPRRAARIRLTEWVKDPKESGKFHKAVACVALASAADKAKIINTSSDKNIVSYSPPRAPQVSPKEGIPTISFQIPDPEHKGKMLNIKSCTPLLDDMDYDPKTMASNINSRTGLGIQHIPKLVLPEHQQ